MLLLLLYYCSMKLKGLFDKKNATTNNSTFTTGEYIIV